MNRTKPNTLVKRIISKWSSVGLILSISLAAAPAATHNVVVSAFTFTPKNLTITNGDTVRWTGGGGSHTVSPRNGATEAFCGSGAITSCNYTFTNVGTFAYQCDFHDGSPFNMIGQVTVVAAPGVPPSISITNPPDNSLFGAPATVLVGIEASDSDGSVMNVQLLTNGVSIATSTVVPFAFTLTNLAAGNYTLRARATDNQALSATSAPVTLRVAPRPALVFAGGTNGPLQFSYPTMTGVNYILESATDVTNFSSLATNPGSGGVLNFTQTNPAPAERFFRVRLE